MLQCNVFNDFERQLWVGEPTIEMNCPSAALSALQSLKQSAASGGLEPIIPVFCRAADARFREADKLKRGIPALN